MVFQKVNRIYHQFKISKSKKIRFYSWIISKLCYQIFLGFRKMIRCWLEIMDKRELSPTEACELAAFVLLLKKRKLIHGMQLNVTIHLWSKIQLVKINFIWATWAHLKRTWIILRDLLKPYKSPLWENNQNYKT